jgi:DNA-binding response OmpR family regulator
VPPFLCYPTTPPAEVLLALTEAGLTYRCIGSASAVTAAEDELGGHVDGAVIVADEDPAEALALCRALRRREEPVQPLLLVVALEHLADLSLREDLFDDFLVTPLRTAELGARLAGQLERLGRAEGSQTIATGPLEINLETYQAAVDGRILDLTYMEYELLRFLAGHPGRVFTRETLLSRVWGYEYYGGARTVDVHVRRLRAKLGEEHAHLIGTVRSVGYRFATS